MEFFKAKDMIRSWSNWVLASVAVTPVLNETVKPIADLLPESWKPWFITGLGIVGLIVRQIKQK
jgi:hypothetical protein